MWFRILPRAEKDVSTAESEEEPMGEVEKRGAGTEDKRRSDTSLIDLRQSGASKKQLGEEFQSLMKFFKSDTGK